MHNPMTEGEALAVLDVDAIASSLVDWMLTKAMPNGDLLHASVACDYAGMANFKRALSKQLRAALREQPEARGVVDDETIERVLNTRMRYGQQLWWVIDRGDGIAIGPSHRAIARCVIEAYTAAQQPVQEGGGEPVEHDECPVCENNRRFCANCGSTGFVPTTAPPSAPAGVEVAVARLAFNEYPRWWVGLKAGQRKLFGREPARWAEEAFKAGARAALAQQPAQAASGDGVVGFRAAFFVSRDGNRIEQLTTYEDYRRDGALLALMDAGQKRASAKGLTKKGGGKVVLAWVTALDPTPPGDDAAGGGHG